MQVANAVNSKNSSTSLELYFVIGIVTTVCSYSFEKNYTLNKRVYLTYQSLNLSLNFLLLFFYMLSSSNLQLYLLNFTHYVENLKIVFIIVHFKVVVVFNDYLFAGQIYDINLFLVAFTIMAFRSDL